jgi:hypothetical protein
MKRQIKKTMAEKPRMAPVSDHTKAVAAIARGKYREHLPHHQRDDEGILWVEKKGNA